MHNFFDPVLIVHTRGSVVLGKTSPHTLPALIYRFQARTSMNTEETLSSCEIFARKTTLEFQLDEAAGEYVGEQLFSLTCHQKKA